MGGFYLDWVRLSFEYARNAQTDVTFLYDQYIKKASILYSINEQKFVYSVYTILITEKKFREVYEYTRLECLPGVWSSVRTRDIWINTTEMPSLVFRMYKFLPLPPSPRIRILNISGLDNFPMGGRGGGRLSRFFLWGWPHPPTHAHNKNDCLQGLCIFLWCLLLSCQHGPQKENIYV